MNPNPSVRSMTAREGWVLKPDSNKTHSELLNTDLSQVGGKILPTDFNNVTSLEGPKILQIKRVKDISNPTISHENGSPRSMFKITLTDGNSTCAAMNLQPVPGIQGKTYPGTKLRLRGRVEVLGGFLLLTPGNCEVLGGRVEKLVESIEKNENISKKTCEEGGPPKFVPFQEVGKSRAVSCVPNKTVSINKTGDVEKGNSDESMKENIVRDTDVRDIRGSEINEDKRKEDHSRTSTHQYNQEYKNQRITSNRGRNRGGKSEYSQGERDDSERDNHSRGRENHSSEKDSHSRGKDSRSRGRGKDNHSRERGKDSYSRGRGRDSHVRGRGRDSHSRGRGRESHSPGSNERNSSRGHEVYGRDEGEYFRGTTEFRDDKDENNSYRDEKRGRGDRGGRRSRGNRGGYNSERSERSDHGFKADGSNQEQHEIDFPALGGDEFPELGAEPAPSKETPKANVHKFTQPQVDKDGFEVHDHLLYEDNGPSHYIHDPSFHQQQGYRDYRSTDQAIAQATSHQVTSMTQDMIIADSSRKSRGLDSQHTLYEGNQRDDYQNRTDHQHYQEKPDDRSFYQHARDSNFDEFHDQNLFASVEGGNYHDRELSFFERDGNSSNSEGPSDQYRRGFERDGNSSNSEGPSDQYRRGYDGRNQDRQVHDRRGQVQDRRGQVHQGYDRSDRDHQDYDRRYEDPQEYDASDQVRQNYDKRNQDPRGQARQGYDSSKLSGHRGRSSTYRPRY